jgi:hypothetical protein
MKANGGGEPKGKLADAIKASFGSLDEFKTQFKAAGVNPMPQPMTGGLQDCTWATQRPCCPASTCAWCSIDWIGPKQQLRLLNG